MKEPILIQFEHRDGTRLVVRGEGFTWIDVGPNEEGKALAGALGVPLYHYGATVSSVLSNADAANLVMTAFEEKIGEVPVKQRGKVAPTLFYIVG